MSGVEGAAWTKRANKAAMWSGISTCAVWECITSSNHRTFHVWQWHSYADQKAQMLSSCLCASTHIYTCMHTSMPTLKHIHACTYKHTHTCTLFSWNESQFKIWQFEISACLKSASSAHYFDTKIMFLLPQMWLWCVFEGCMCGRDHFEKIGFKIFTVYWVDFPLTLSNRRFKCTSL